MGQGVGAPACTWCTGFVGLKTHAKCVLVVRADDDGLRRYCHIGTGNYNSRTARLYEDVGFLTCDPPVGDDVAQLFNHLTGYSRAHDYYSLLVAPRDMRGPADRSHRARGHLRQRRPDHGQDELGRRPEMVEALYAASNAGRADRFRRARHLLPAARRSGDEREHSRPFDPRSRYLEHSRIIRFGHGDEGRPLFLIGSADWMPRNLDRRIEVLVPVEHPKHQAWLEHVFTTLLDPDVVRWEMDGDGSWQRSGPELFTDGDAQERFYQWVADRQRR